MEKPTIKKDIVEQLNKMSTNLGLFRESLEGLANRFPEDNHLRDIISSTKMLEGVYDTWLVNMEDNYEITE